MVQTEAVNVSWITEVNLQSVLGLRTGAHISTLLSPLLSEIFRGL